MYHWTNQDPEWMRLYDGMTIPPPEAFVPNAADLERDNLRIWALEMNKTDYLVDEMFDNCTNSEMIDAAELDGLPIREYLDDINADIEAERQAEERWSDWPYVPETPEEAEMRFIDSLTPYPRHDFDEYQDEMKS